MSVESSPPESSRADNSGRGVRPWSFGWRTGVFRSRLWLWSWLGWTVFVLLPLWTGWLLKLAFDALDQSRSINRYLLAIGASEVVRWSIFAFAIWVVVRWWFAGMTLFRTNMLHAQTVSGGPDAATLPGSPSEAISRFSDDARDAVAWTDSWLDGFGYVLFGAGALIVMSSIDGRAALVVVIPLVLVTAITRVLVPRLYAARSADRAASGVVTSFLGEAFTGMLAFRLAGREEAAISRLERHTAVRRRTAVRDTVLQQVVDGLSSSTASLTIGLMLLVLVPRVQAGELSVGDVALFVAYSTQLGEIPRYVARIITSREQAIVSYGRMGDLVAKDRLEDILAPRPITIERRDVMLEREPDPARRPLERLEVRGLTVRYPSSGDGITDVSFTIERGSFTVVTGPVGAGKSTLLRALIGLVPLDAGTVRWNGDEIDDLAAFFVPPNAAHLPQIPRLFSESLRANIALGRSTDHIESILDLTTLRQDLEDMPDGLDTVVGARGLRLSGGQAQRVATARSLLTQPELLVVDDLSSALDVSTERELWNRLNDLGETTVLAISHRQLALDRADQVITMVDGRITAID